MKKYICIIGLTVIFAGCATERVMSTGAKYAPNNSSSVKLYLSEKPKVAYEELGRVSVDKYNNFGITRASEEMNAQLKEKAASIGGNGIIGITEDFASMSGVVIRVSDISAKVEPPQNMEPQQSAVRPINDSPTVSTSSIATHLSLKEAQAILNRLGFKAGTPDGMSGKMTVNALSAFQKANGIVQSGKLDLETEQLLRQR